MRQQLIDLLENILTRSYKDFLPVLTELCNMIGKLLTDQCPEVKIKSSEFIINLCACLGKNMGPHTKAIINSLCLNLKHSHNKIRKITLQAINKYNLVRQSYILIYNYELSFYLHKKGIEIK